MLRYEDIVARPGVILDAIGHPGGPEVERRLADRLTSDSQDGMFVKARNAERMERARATQQSFVTWWQANRPTKRLRALGLDI